MTWIEPVADAMSSSIRGKKVLPSTSTSTSVAVVGAHVPTRSGWRTWSTAATRRAWSIAPSAVTGVEPSGSSRRGPTRRMKYQTAATSAPKTRTTRFINPRWSSCRQALEEDQRADQGDAGSRPSRHPRSCRSRAGPAAPGRRSACAGGCRASIGDQTGACQMKIISPTRARPGTGPRVRAPMRYPPATMTSSRPNDWKETPAPRPAAASTEWDDGCGGRFLRRRSPTTMKIAAPIIDRAEHDVDLRVGAAEAGRLDAQQADDGRHREDGGAPDQIRDGPSPRPRRAREHHAPTAPGESARRHRSPRRRIAVRTSSSGPGITTPVRRGAEPYAKPNRIDRRAVGGPAGRARRRRDGGTDSGRGSAAPQRSRRSQEDWRPRRGRRSHRSRASSVALDARLWPDELDSRLGQLRPRVIETSAGGARDRRSRVPVTASDVAQSPGSSNRRPRPGGGPRPGVGTTDAGRSPPASARRQGFQTDTPG